MRECKALPTENKNKTIKKMVVGSYISIITLSVNELNAPTKKQTGCADENLHMYALPLTTSLCLTPQIVCNYFTLSG